jgi:signal transduction histidine kinase
MGIALENHELFYSLKASRDELERANRVKDEFLSVMSHELRTPLSVILGYSAMFQDRQLGPLTNEQKHAVDSVLRNSKELLEMIESIMDATKIEAGSMAAEMDPYRRHNCSRKSEPPTTFPSRKMFASNGNFRNRCRCSARTRASCARSSPT